MSQQLTPMNQQPQLQENSMAENVAVAQNSNPQHHLQQQLQQQQTQHVYRPNQNHSSMQQPSSNYATLQPGAGPATQDAAANQAGVNASPPKVPPLAFNSVFNLQEAPLMRFQDDKSQQSGSQVINTQGDNGNPARQQYLDSNGQQNMMTTEMDAQKRPPVTIRQTQCIYLTHKDSKHRSNGNVADATAKLAFNVSQNATNGFQAGMRDMNMQQPRDQLGEILFLSNQEASLTARAQGGPQIDSRKPLGCRTFQAEVRRGVHAICTTPEGNCVAILTRDFSVLVHDTVSRKTFGVAPLEASFFEDEMKNVSFESLIEQSRARNMMKNGMQNLPPTLGKYSLHVSSGMTSIFVLSESQRLVATWNQTFGQEEKKKSDKRPRQESKLVLEQPQVRSSSARRNFAQKSTLKSQTFADFIGNIEQKQNEPNKRSVSKKKKGGSRAKNVRQPVIDLDGCWTNITLNYCTTDRLDTISALVKPLVSTHAVQQISAKSASESFQNNLPVRFGHNRNAEQLGEQIEEPSLISVKMYDYATYTLLFDDKMYCDLTNEGSPRTFKKNKQKVSIDRTKNGKLECLDSDTRKMLVFSQQFVAQDKMFKGNVWYQNPYYLVQKMSFSTEIEYMGLLSDADSTAESVKTEEPKTLISRSDNQGNLLAVAVNSIHKIYCQILFVNLSNQFVSIMKLFEFVSAEDNPPFDSRGKTNLQVDDLAWTRNDAFLILMFNTGAIAVLPRLGSQLLKIYNPTVSNVHQNDITNLNNYKVPRGFNELFPNAQVTELVKQKRQKNGQQLTAPSSSSSSTGYRISMHPNEEAFIVFNGHVAFIMQLELEPELQELFDHENKSYYFMRFCFSMKSLSKDQETLQKIPQLLTSKLPICEFDKNQDKLENQTEEENIGKRIQTASQINPWQADFHRMDTIQSFDADFNEESEIVLLNFKHLLFSYRWNAATTLNYLEWLITVTNDIFYYFLKQSEPMYAYHTLKISEYYMKNVFQKSKNISPYKPMEDHKTKLIQTMQKYMFAQMYSEQDNKSQIHSSIERTTKLFKGLYQRMIDPVIEIYTQGLECKTLHDEIEGQDAAEKVKEELKFLIPPQKTLVDKIKQRNDFIEQAPLFIAEGDGNTTFSFQKNYILLAYYCLIQFRNYQAGNFNILFLILSSYIVKNHVNASFIDALQRFTCVIIENFTRLEKTDELDLFFGRCGRNQINDCPKAIQFTQKWIEIVTPYQSSFTTKVFHKKNLYAIQARHYKKLMSSTKSEVRRAYKLVDQPQENPAEIIRKEAIPLINFFDSLEALDWEIAITDFSTFCQNYRNSRDLAYMISPTQVFGISLTVFANSLYHLVMPKSHRASKTLSSVQALEALAKQAIKMDKKSPINTVSEHTKIYESAFHYKYQNSKILESKKELKERLELQDEMALKKFTAMLLAYSGDHYRAGTVLKPSISHPSNIDLLLFNLVIQSETLKSNTNNFSFLRDKLQDYSMKNVKDFKSLHQTTERLNSMHTIKFTVSEIQTTMYRITCLAGNSAVFKEYLWASCLLVAPAIEIIFKEQIARDSLTTISSILKFQTADEKNDPSDYFPKELVLGEFPLAKDFFEKTLEENVLHLEYLLPPQPIVRKRFFQNVELLLICFYDQHRSRIMQETVQELQNQQKRKSKQQNFELASERVLKLMMKDFNKFVKIFTYLKLRTDMRSMDCAAQQLRETQPLKAIESQIMIVCKILQHMVHFAKLTNVQNHLKRALSILTHLLFHIGNTISLEIRIKILLPLLKMISYSKLNRQNKQIISGLLEKCKQKQLQEQMSQRQEWEPIVAQLESTIFDLQDKLQNDQAAQSANPTLKKPQGENESPEVVEFRSMIEEVNTWLRQTILQSINFADLNLKGQNRAYAAKKSLFELAEIMHCKMKLPMTNTSLYFRGINFEVKHVNTFHIDDRDLEGFNKVCRADEIKRKQREGQDQIQNQQEPEKTLCHKLIEQIIIHENKVIPQYPNLDLDVLIQGSHQLSDMPDLPHNMDLGDINTITGSGVLYQELRLILEQQNVKQQMREEETKTSAVNSVVDLNNYSSEKSSKQEEKGRKSSITGQPLAFSNQMFSLTDLTQTSAQSGATTINSIITTSQQDQDNAAAKPGAEHQTLISSRGKVGEASVAHDSSTGQRSLGKIVFKQRATNELTANERRKKPAHMRTTVRKNSAKRRMGQIQNLAQSEKDIGQKISNWVKQARRQQDKSKPMKLNFKNSSEAHADIQALKPFNLVYLKRKKNSRPVEQQSEQSTHKTTIDSKTEDANEDKAAVTTEQQVDGQKSQYKVEMPFKMIAQTFAKETMNRLQQTTQATTTSQAATEAPDKDQYDLSGHEDHKYQAESKASDIGLTKQSAPPRQRIKPFQVQLVKVNKISPRSSSKPDPASSYLYPERREVDIVKNIQQECADMSRIDKKDLMKHLIGKLESIQHQTDMALKLSQQAKPTTAAPRE